MEFQGVIFDFNGVLWWDGPLHERAWQQLAVEIRGRSLSEEEIAAHVHGRTNRAILEYLSGRAMAKHEFEELAQRKEALYRRLCLELGPEFRLSPGADDLLDFLAAHRVPRTIATSSDRINLDFFIQHLRLERWFEVALLVYDDGLRPGKPAPDIYLQAAHNLGLEPLCCMVVEDSRAGVQAAHTAGIGHIIALGPAHRHAQLAQLEGVDEVIENLEQFPAERLSLRDPT